MNNGTMANGIGLFSRFAPKPKSIFIPIIGKFIDAIANTEDIAGILSGEKALSDVIANKIVGKITGFVKKPFKNILIEAAESQISLFGKNGFV